MADQLGRISLSDAMIAKLLLISDEQNLTWLPMGPLRGAAAGRKRVRGSCLGAGGARDLLAIDRRARVETAGVASFVRSKVREQCLETSEGTASFGGGCSSLIMYNYCAFGMAVAGDFAVPHRMPKSPALGPC
jgi:hypothetical protein